MYAQSTRIAARSRHLLQARQSAQRASCARRRARIAMRTLLRRLQTRHASRVRIWRSSSWSSMVHHRTVE